MKKGFIAAVAALSLICVTNVDAMSKTELKNKLTASYTINGEKFQLTSSQIVQVERYLNTFEVSSEDADYIASKVDEAVNIIASGDAKKIEDLSESERNKLTTLVNDISKSTSVKATVTNGDLVIYNPNTGDVFTKITDPAKKTGMVNYILIASGLVVLVGASTLVIKRVKSETV